MRILKSGNGNKNKEFINFSKQRLYPIHRFQNRPFSLVISQPHDKGKFCLPSILANSIHNTPHLVNDLMGWERKGEVLMDNIVDPILQPRPSSVDKNTKVVFMYTQFNRRFIVLKEVWRFNRGLSNQFMCGSPHEYNQKVKYIRV